jgi:hypothetical protein
MPAAYAGRENGIEIAVRSFDDQKSQRPVNALVGNLFDSIYLTPSVRPPTTAFSMTLLHALSIGLANRRVFARFLSAREPPRA